MVAMRAARRGRTDAPCGGGAIRGPATELSARRIGPQVQRRPRGTAGERVLGVDALPPAPGEGLRPLPRGSDWPASRAAGLNAEPLEASPGATASPDGDGDAPEGPAPVERWHQRKRLRRWSHKGHGPWAGGLLHVRPSPPTGPGGVVPRDVQRHTRSGTGVTPCGLCGDDPSYGAGANRRAHGEVERRCRDQRPALV